MKTILFRFLPRGARGFVPRPILTVAWLGLEDKGNFQCKYACDSPYRCEQFFAHNLHKRPKHHQENTPIHQRKKYFVFQAQPRNREYGSWNKPTCEKRQTIFIFLLKSTPRMDMNKKQ
jgi:hypothetical protein